jgi:hypothetical protein
MPRRNSSADEFFPSSGNASASPSTDFSYEAEIVRRTATISQFHAPSSRATLVSARLRLIFLCAHCVDTFAQVTVDPFEPSRFVGCQSSCK